MTLSVSELNQRFSIPGMRFDTGSGELTRVVIDNSVAGGELYLHGAHVTRYQPIGSGPVLWMSDASLFESNKPIRGGVPICFPWFGPHPSDSQSPSHGWARLADWEVFSCGSLLDGGNSIELRTCISDFQLSYFVEFGATLRMTLSVQLLPGLIAPSRFEEALHTYLCVSDVRQISIHGLERTGYVDKVAGAIQREPSSQPIQFTGETDRVYHDTISECVMVDKDADRKITVRKLGSHSTVIWNPWIVKSQKMPDFGDHEWTEMVCIESANIGPNAIEISPGQIHSLKTEIELSHP